MTSKYNPFNYFCYNSLHLCRVLSMFLILLAPSLALNLDGTLLLTFKYSILSDPLSVLHNWDYNDATPCSWTGVACAEIVNTFGVPVKQFPERDFAKLTFCSLRAPNPFLVKQCDLGCDSSLKNLIVVSLKGNYLSGPVPNGIKSLEVLDLSSNLLNGSLPPEFGGEKLWYLNISSNNLSGSLPPQFAAKFPQNATIDLSFNDLSGKIPVSTSTISMPPNVSSANTSSPAIAAIPRPIKSSPGPESSADQVPPQHGLKPGAIAGIVIVPLAGAAILAAISLCIYQKQKKSNAPTKHGLNSTTTINVHEFKNKSETPSAVKEKRSLPAWPCLNTTNGEETSEATGSDSDENTNPETLLKASAYVLGSSGGTILYKAVLGDGTAFAVRRIGESSVQKLSEFENHVKAIAKLRHQNIVRVRGFYWGEHEKLVIHDYVSNGSLANVGHRKNGPSPSQLTFNTRLKIVKGVARGLNFIHEKKHVHGSIKPSNILLTPEMAPLISDLGLHWLIQGRRSDASCRDLEVNGRRTSPYSAPESLDCSQKPKPQWDVYSLGILLVELLTGRAFSELEMSQWTGDEEPDRVLKMADVGISGDVAEREDATMAWFKLGISCASSAPQKRPSMKDVVGVLERIPFLV